MVKFLDRATESHWVRLSETYSLVWLPLRAWLEKLFKTFFYFFEIVIKIFKALKIFVSCLKNEAVNQLKANFIYWKATRVCPDYTHRLAVCAHFERHLPHLYGLWYYKLVKVFIISICIKLFQRKAYSKGVISITMV